MPGLRPSNPKITAEMMQQSRGMMEKFAAIGIAIFIPIAIFLVGLALWVVGKFVDRLARDLKLSAPERTQVEKVLAESGVRRRELRREPIE